MFTNSPLHFSQHPFIKPAELFLYVFLIIASERSRMVYLTFWCPSGNNAINHLWPLLFQADICCRVTHWLSRLGLLPFPTQIDRQTDTHTHRHIHTAPALGRIQVRQLVEFPSNSPDLLLPSAEILPMGTSEQVSKSTPAMGLGFNWNWLHKMFFCSSTFLRTTEL